MNKCIDFEGITPPCKKAGHPDAIGVFTTNTMIALGYIKCDGNHKHYLANADRVCKRYK